MTAMTPEEILAAARAAAGAPAVPTADFAQWRSGFRVQPDTFATALSCGLAAGQLAFCFAGGYQAALRRLLPALPSTAFAALLLSEGGRQRPAELQTTLHVLADGALQLDGEKSFVTGAAAADPLLVVARYADAQPPRAVLLQVPAGLPGIRITERGDVGLLAALPHGRAHFDAVRIDASMIVPGDGWADHARPFRTHEDIHVSAAVAAHLAVTALREGWPQALLATLLACLLRLAQCAARDARDPVTHLLLAAAEAELQQVAGAVNGLLAGRDDAFAADWRANAVMLALAGPARAKRLEKAVARWRDGGEH